MILCHEAEARESLTFTSWKLSLVFYSTFFWRAGEVMRNRCFFLYNTLSSGSCSLCTCPCPGKREQQLPHLPRVLLRAVKQQSKGFPFFNSQNFHWLFPILIPKDFQSAQNTTLKNIYWAFFWLGSFDGNISSSGIFRLEIRAQVLHSTSTAHCHEARGFTVTLWKLSAHPH